MQPNFLKLDHRSFFRSKFIFVDTEDYLSAKLLKEAGIIVRHVRVMTKKGSPYRLVICKIRRRHEGTFVKVMEELRNRLILLGYTGYDAICDRLANCR